MSLADDFDNIGRPKARKVPAAAKDVTVVSPSRKSPVPPEKSFLAQIKDRLIEHLLTDPTVPVHGRKMTGDTMFTNWDDERKKAK